MNEPVERFTRATIFFATHFSPITGSREPENLFLSPEFERFRAK